MIPAVPSIDCRSLRVIQLLFLAAFLFSGVPVSAQSSEDRVLLSEKYPMDKLSQLIQARDEWHPYPTIENPDGLDEVPGDVRRAYIREAEKMLDDEWKPLPATLFLAYVRNGNRSRFEGRQFGRRERLTTLVLAELFEREGRFIDPIVNGIWAICEESFWGVPAHLDLQEEGYGLPDVSDPVVDLFAAETASLLAWTHYLLEPRLNEVDSLLADRIEYEVDRRVLTPYLEHTNWWWMGYTWRSGEREKPVNNWNPWINSNVIASALLLEDELDRRLRLVHKAMYSTDAFIEPYPADGGCDEGPSYWNRAGGSLFDVLHLLHSASDGAIDIYDQPLIRKMGQYIYQVYIDYPYFINFADAPAKIHPNAPLIYQYGTAIEDETMKGFAAFVAREDEWGTGTVSTWPNLARALPALFTLDELLDEEPIEPLVRDAWFPDLQVMVARSKEGTKEGFYLAAKGGHNNESHNHNDVGNYIVYHDGNPVLIDAGRQTYTRKTFSPQRYEIWNNQSRFHNVPTINGITQPPGRQFEAQQVEYRSDADDAVFALDLAAAYPDSARVTRWHRTITLERGRAVIVEEDYRLQTYLEPFALNYLTPLEVSKTADGQVRLRDSVGGAAYRLTFDSALLRIETETIAIDDPHMRDNWGPELRRIQLMSATDAREGEVRITLERE